MQTPFSLRSFTPGDLQSGLGPAKILIYHLATDKDIVILYQPVYVPVHDKKKSVAGQLEGTLNFQ